MKANEFFKLPEVQANGKNYQWDEDYNGYFGYETSCGVYGAILNRVSGKWDPAWYNDGGVETASEEYTTLEEAITRSHFFWS
jgi:hypothetical protein